MQLGVAELGFGPRRVILSGSSVPLASLRASSVLREPLRAASGDLVLHTCPRPEMWPLLTRSPQHPHGLLPSIPCSGAVALVKTHHLSRI